MVIADFKQYKDETLPIVTSKEIYLNGNTEKFHPEGLYSEVIFGPKKPYHCTCGALNHKSYEGETCDICGVSCDDGTRRKEQYAKIQLRKKVLLPMFEKAIRAIFGIKAIKDIFSIAKYKSNLVDPYYFDASTFSLKKRKSIKNLEETIFITKPVYDIASLNALFDFLSEDELYRPGIESQIVRDHIPFVFSNTIIVYPPETRPIVMSGQKKDIPDISKFYKKLLANTTGTFWDKFSENDEEYNKNIYTIQKIVNEMYTLSYERGLCNKTSTLRESINGATVEYSGRSTIIPEPALKPYGVGLSADTVKKIFSPDLLHYIYKTVEQPRMLFDENKTIDSRFDVFKLLSYINSGKFNIDIPDEFFEKFLKDVGKNLLCFIERAPVLWRFNFSGVFIEVVLTEKDGYALFDDSKYFGPRLAKTNMYTNKVMQVNTMVSAAFNFDFDGDNMSIMGIHSTQGKKDFYNGYLGNPENLTFEHNGLLLAFHEHEAVYAFWALTDKVKHLVDLSLDNLATDLLPDFNVEKDYVDARVLNNNPDQLVNYFAPDLEESVVLPYNIAALNKAAGITIFKTNPGPCPKKAVKKINIKMLEIVGKDKYYEHVHELNKFLLMCSTMVSYCNPTFSAKDFAISSDDIQEYKKTLINEPFIGFHQNDILFTDYVKPEIAKDPMNSLYRVSESDARIKSVQLLKAASNNGIPTDIHGKAYINNIKEDLLSGHTKEGFFQSGDSARLALAQRQEAIPRGGELQRRFFWITGFLQLARTDDCGSKRTLPIEIRSKGHLESLHGRFYVTEKNLEITHSILKNNNLKVIDKNDPESEKLIGKTLNFRSPIFCEHPGYKICDKCMGTQQTKSVNLGAAIGSYIPEAIIQSVLRAHHFGGAFITKIRKEILELIKNCRFESPDLIFIKTMEDYHKLKSFYDEVYENGEEDIRIIPVPELNGNGETCYRIQVINPPFNDDSVKQLNKIIQILDKDRNEENLLPLNEMYNQLLDEIVLPNGIYSIFIELIMSLMFYDENDIIIRYGGEPHHQTALKKIIQKCDPRLSIFYNLNANAIALILRDEHKILGAKHMLSGLITPYKK